MDSDQHYSLRWNNFLTNVLTEFDSLRHNENLTDVTLSCEGKQIKAHKLVLSASSPYFKQIFSDNPCEHSVVVLQDVDHHILTLLIEYVYTGGINVSEHLMTTLLDTADSLQIRGLAESTSASTPMLHSGRSSKSKTMNNNRTVSQPQAKRICLEPSYCDTSEIDDYDEKFNPKISIDVAEKLSGKYFADNSPFDGQQSNFLEFSGKTEPVENLPSPNFYNYSAECGSTDTVRNGGEQSRSHSLDPRPCPVCGHVYSNLSNLRQHIRLIHNPESVSCPLCAKTFKNKLYLKRHLTSFHEVVSPSQSQDQNRVKAAMYSSLVNNAMPSVDHTLTPADPRSYSHIMSTQTISPRKRHDEINNMFAQKNILPLKNSSYEQNLDNELESEVNSSSINNLSHFVQYNKNIVSNTNCNVVPQNEQTVSLQGKHHYLPDKNSNSTNEI